MSAFARDAIERLGLSPHPEGGWYRRTWQSAQGTGDAGTALQGEFGQEGPRPLCSLIYFLLPAGEASAWHVVDADEVWLWHGPGSVTLELGGMAERPDEAGAQPVTLGVSATGAVRGHHVIPAHTWQRTVPSDEDALVSCVVSPGFTYGGFALA